MSPFSFVTAAQSLSEMRRFLFLAQGETLTETIGLKAVLDTGAFDSGLQKYISGLNKMEAGTNRVVQSSLKMTKSGVTISQTFKDTSQALKQAETTAQSASLSFGQVVSKMAALGATLGVVNQVKDFTLSSKEMAQSQNDARNALTQLVGGAEQYRAAIDQVKTASRNTVSETEAARAAFGLLDNGIAKSAEEAANYVLAGKALNAALGETASYEKFLMLLDEGSDMLLNNFNITGSAVEARQRLVEATTGLEGSEARLQAVRQLALEKGLSLQKSLSDETVQTQQATAAAADFSAAFGQLVIAVDKSVGVTALATEGFRKLTEGAKAWQYVITEAVPAIEQHNQASDQAVGKQLAMAQSLDDVKAAMSQNIHDYDQVKAGIVGAVGSVEEYNAVLDNLAAIEDQTHAGLGSLIASLVITEDSFKAAKVEVAAQTVALEKNRGAAWMASYAASRLAAEQAKLAQNAGASSQALAAVTARYQGLANAERTMTAGHSVLETMAQGETLTGPEAEQMAELAKQQEKFSKQSATAMTKSFDQAANNLRSTIESVIKPSLSEVWQPAGEEGNIDEWARRVATVATSGFSSEWLNQAAAQFGGQSFFQPIMDAMQGGDEGALKAAANDLLTRNVTALWDVETIKARVRQQLQEQNLRQAIIDQVQAELSAEGVNVSPEAVAAVAGGASQAAGGMAQANQATADMGTTAGATQTALDNLALSLDTISNVKIVVLITKTGELQTAIGKLSVGVTTASEEMITALTAAVPKMQDVIKLADWVSLGKSIDEGIVKGIRGNEHLVYEKLKAMAVEALKQAGDAIGYGSPAAKFVPLGASIPEGVELGMMSNSGLVQKAYDKLFNIDRSTTSLDKILHQSRYKLTSFGKGQLSMGEEKVTYVLNTIQKDFSNNASKILNAVNPMAAFQEFVSSHEWRKANIKDRDATAIAQRFYQNFLKESAKAQAALQKIIVEGSRKAIDLAGSLSDVATAGAQQLNGEIDMLAQLLNTGASEFMLDGQIYSAAEATDLLNQKMQEQASIQDDLLQLQQSQSQLNFLEKQLSLIETINKAGLNPADVLGGADLSTVSGLVAASQNAIASIIGQVSSDIGAYTPVQGSQTINNRAVNLNMGGVNISNGMSLNNLTSLIQRTVANGFG